MLAEHFPCVNVPAIMLRLSSGYLKKHSAILYSSLFSQKLCDNIMKNQHFADEHFRKRGNDHEYFSTYRFFSR